uniref:Uncharacterized protein n=1 Tax=Tanacetum cinerariifolium TaxID=118510 RepID=A0A6L2JZ91_TANCI|nr:hypothetical protein [Tanacetum cinerariifolium]
MEEYIRLEEEKARRHGKVYNWETAKYDKILVDTAYSLNEYSVFDFYRYKYSVSWGMDTAYRLPVQF